MELKGTVTEFKFTSPHTFVLLEVKGTDGSSTVWNLEGASPSALVREGWSTKKLVRLIVLSRAYRQSSLSTRQTVAADPENRLFGRANRRRLDVEHLPAGAERRANRLDRRGRDPPNGAGRRKVDHQPASHSPVDTVRTPG